MIELSSLRLNPDRELKRIPTRLPEFREASFDEKFDWLTVFYDVFFDPKNEQVICVGPPLWNLGEFVIKSLKREFKKKLFSRIKVLDLDRCSVIRFHPKNLSVNFSDGRFSQQRLSVQPNNSDIFRGRRVIHTMSRDNDLAWVREWATFYAVNHGCDAVLFYDNGSKSYGVAELRELLLSIKGIKTAVVIDWPFSYGPAGYDTHKWDSDFSQYGIFEHARWRFLSAAEGVINSDIDELIVTKSGASIFELLKKSETGYLLFPGLWIENATESDSEGVKRHRDFVYTNFVQAGYKWAVDPKRCGLTNQWAVHWVANLQADELSADLSLRHFKAISTDWAFKRVYTQKPEAPMVREEIIARWMERLP